MPLVVSWIPSPRPTTGGGAGLGDCAEVATLAGPCLAGDGSHLSSMACPPTGVLSAAATLPPDVAADLVAAPLNPTLSTQMTPLVSIEVGASAGHGCKGPEGLAQLPPAPPHLS